MTTYHITTTATTTTTTTTELGHLLKSRRALMELGTPRSGQVRKWNWVTVRVSPVCRFFR